MDATKRMASRVLGAIYVTTSCMLPGRDESRYEIGPRIGAGGMARVHLGTIELSNGFRRKVAIKLLHPELGRDPEIVSSLIHEARIAGALHHPNLVPALDLTSIDGAPAMIMEYVDGVSLHELGRRVRGPLPLPISAAIVVAVLSGLAHAHELRDEQGRPLGLVHHDVSPHNVLIGADGVVRLTDFGVARTRKLARDKTGLIRGKPSYAAPEVVFGVPYDRRSDLFSMGVVLWELLTGKRLPARKVSGGVPPPSTFNHRIPTALDRIVARALDPDPERRFACADAMADAIELVIPIASNQEVVRWLRSCGVTRQPPRAAAQASLAVAFEPRLRADRLALPGKTFWAATAAVGALVLAAAPLVALAVVRELSPSVIGHRHAFVLTDGALPRSVAHTSSPHAGGSASSAAPERFAPAQISGSATPAPAACEPPFAVDARGVRRFKAECVQSR